MTLHDPFREDVMRALEGRVDSEYATQRVNAALREAVRTHDGANISLRDSTGVTLSGPALSVAPAFAEAIVATCPDAFRAQSEPAPTTNWDAHRAAARARQDAKAGGVTEAARKKLEAL